MTGWVRSRFETFGFIKAADTGRSYYFHNSDVVGGVDVEKSDRVVFDVFAPEPAKGPRATNVALEVSR